MLDRMQTFSSKNNGYCMYGDHCVYHSVYGTKCIHRHVCCKYMLIHGKCKAKDCKYSHNLAIANEVPSEHAT